MPAEYRENIFQVLPAIQGNQLLDFIAWRYAIAALLTVRYFRD